VKELEARLDHTERQPAVILSRKDGEGSRDAMVFAF